MTILVPNPTPELSLEWNRSSPLTLGVECELQLTDWKTQDLCPASQRVLERCTTGLVKTEIYQSMVELCTEVCSNLSQVENDLRRGQQDVLQAANSLGVEILGSGTHPFAERQQRLLTPGSPRFALLLERNQWIARRMAIYGLHVHVGVAEADQCIHLMNGMMPYLGGLLALSASSPFWSGEDTGLSSARATVFESQPTGGCPPSFRDWAHFESHCRRLSHSRSIVSLKDLWWDLRPSPGYGTVEVRICDGTASLSETLGLVAMIQCLAARLLEQLELGIVPAPPGDWRVRENKWRALRWGLEAKLIEDEAGNVTSARELVNQWLEELHPYAIRLECLDHLAPIRRLLESGSSADRQRQIYRQTGSLRSVVQALVEEWRTL